MDCFSVGSSLCKICKNALDRERYKENGKRVAAKNKRNRYLKHDQYKKKERERIARYRLTNPNWVLIKRLRRRIRQALKYTNNRKDFKSISLLGMSVPAYRNYLESKFTEGMTWDLFHQGKIHIDHIRPCSSFDLSIPEEQFKCFNYSNTQPLWAHDNLSKGDSMPPKIDA